MTSRPTVHVLRRTAAPPPACEAGRVIQLARRAVAVEPMRGAPVEVRCERGTLWVTLDGAYTDVVLEAGDAAVFDGRGRIVLEALTDATARLCPALERAA